jgi:hypothetical protein
MDNKITYILLEAQEKQNQLGFKLLQEKHLPEENKKEIVKTLFENWKAGFQLLEQLREIKG